jgi:Meiotically Up-regulated Gene 113 (MUG113) protein
VNCVYFIQAESGPIKIGFTTDVRMRLAALQTATAEELTLVGIMPGDEKDEAALHARFASSRIRGEWFRPDEEIRAFISGLGRWQVASRDEIYAVLDVPTGSFRSTTRARAKAERLAAVSSVFSREGALRGLYAVLGGLDRLGILVQDRWLLLCLASFQDDQRAVVSWGLLESVSGLSLASIDVGLARLQRHGLSFEKQAFAYVCDLRGLLSTAAEAEQAEHQTLHSKEKHARKILKISEEKLSVFEARFGIQNTERSGS